MASAVAGGLFNAFAFAGAGYLFKMFDKNGYAKEAHRHNIAMENLTAEREKYLEEVTDRRNRLAQLREMDWLAMVDVDEVVTLGKRVDTIEELEAAVKKYVEWRIIRRRKNKPQKQAENFNTYSIGDGLADTGNT
ncbi:Hypothetical predicted protein [Paramuricea clavata]|uniref:Uncharacterized protein n=1 Tax=Paramuricea clavata TaxID=317549 RepID=A0A7D9IQC7_PARCT|nr:Hypothetical predicted protein [Paramuricea clavata]